MGLLVESVEGLETLCFCAELLAEVRRGSITGIGLFRDELVRDGVESKNNWQNHTDKMLDELLLSLGIDEDIVADQKPRGPASKPGRENTAQKSREQIVKH